MQYVIAYIYIIYIIYIYIYISFSKVKKYYHHKYVKYLNRAGSSTQLSSF